AAGRGGGNPPGPLPLQRGARGPRSAGHGALLRHRPGRGPGGADDAGQRPRRRRGAVERDVVQGPSGGRPVRRAVEPPPPHRHAPHAVRDRGPDNGRGAGGGRHRLHEAGARPGGPMGAGALRRPRHRRLRAVGHVGQPPPPLRDRRRPRGGGRPRLAGPGRRGQARGSGRRHRPLRPRRRDPRPPPALTPLPPPEPPPPHPETPPFVFVVGCARSGTTLVRSLLDSHPELAVPGESYFVPWLAERFEVWDEARFLDEVTTHPRFLEWGLGRDVVAAELARSAAATYADGVRAVYRCYAAAEGKPRYGDKTPGYVFTLALLGDLFPEARFVQVVRDGRDAAVSIRAAATETRP